MVGGTTTRASLWRKRVKQSGLILWSAAAIVAGCWFDIAPAQAQLMNFPVRPPVQKPAPASTRTNAVFRTTPAAKAPPMSAGA